MGSCWITLIVLFQFGDELQTTCTQLQFGFKAKSSTNLGLCTFVLKEALSYYATNQSNVFCTFLDATKAFDRIDYCKLFRLLLKRDLPACILRVLLCFYTKNFVRVSWCGLFSEYFLATNGVKQGGVLSPVLFCVYIDDLLVRLSNANVGCFGATENARHENMGRSKMQGWKMRDVKMRDQFARVENAGKVSMESQSVKKCLK